MAEKKPEEVKALNIYQKLAAIMGEIGAVAKDGQNTEQKYAFIEYAAIAGKLRILFAKYGVVVVPRMQRSSKQQRTEVLSKYGAKGNYVLIDMYFDVVNADDPKDHFTVQWTGEAADYGDKATNKAATGALKYYLMRQFNISEKGEDADADSHEIVSAKPAIGTVQKAAPQAPTPAPASDEPIPPAVEGVTKPQLAKMQIMLAEMGITERDDKIQYVALAAGREVISSTELTKVEAGKVIERLDLDIQALSEALDEGTE